MKTKVQVRDLRKGDVLSSGAVIDKAPMAGIHTPMGKVEVRVLYPLQVVPRLFYWGKYTTVTVTNR